jgi:heptosyltransferase II
MDKIIFFHMNQLGDLLFCLPVMKAARQELRNTKILSLIRAELGPLLVNSGVVDEVINKNNMFSAVKKLREEKIDTAVLFSESPYSALTSRFSRIPKRIGFSNGLGSVFLTEKIKRSGVPSLANNLQLGRRLGLKTIKPNYTFIIKIPEEENVKVEKWIIDNKIDEKKLIVLSPGASAKRTEKCWAKKNWEELQKLLAENNYHCVLSGSPGEKEFLESIAGQTGYAKVFPAVGGIMSTCALMARSRLFVGIDSGAMHLAAGLGVKVIALFGTTDPLQVGPQPLEKHIIIKRDNTNDITAQEVFEKIQMGGQK